MFLEAVLNRESKEVKVIDINNPSGEVISKEAKVSEEKIKRSLAKTISWRIIGTLDTLLLSWIITGEASLAFTIASVEFASKMILYFSHKRTWNNIKWSK